MENYLYLVLITLAVLAIIDLMVGVSNDAVNFLNSAIGSKAIPFKTIMIIASLGILFGSVFSSGMMEIARSGIYVPSKFTFEDVMAIFLAVMITDIILLDIFNYFGLPTSTTVSIVFELLGAAISLAVFKIVMTDASWSTLSDYINTEKASEIVYSILLSVVISFSVGMLVQYISRVLFTFQFEKKLKTVGVVFGGIAMASITYFILIKGLKEVSFLNSDIKSWIKSHELLLLGGSLIVCTIISFIITQLRINILKVIIGIGTFALALSFAGNDLVNFIGVPVAAIQSIEIFQSVPGASPDSFTMDALASSEIVAPLWILLAAGIIMVITLWTSKKAKTVIETEMSLSNQGDGNEKFESNFLSRTIVRGFIRMGSVLSYVMPKTLQSNIDKKFETPMIAVGQQKPKGKDEPMFDMIRASVNLMVASSLIALGTSMKLPLSTTYVTFMVAMGTAFADRAWGRESAVYRVSGVFHVIGGWFVTAGCAFAGAFIIAYFLKVGGIVTFVIALVVLALLLYRNAKSHDKKIKAKALQELNLDKSDILSLQQVMETSANQISETFSKANIFYKDAIDSLIKEDLEALKINKKLTKKLMNDLNSTNNSMYNFIRNLDDSSVKGSRYYIISLGYLQDMIENVAVINSNALNHVDNNHKTLRISQAKDLKYVVERLGDWFSKINMAYKRQDFSKMDSLIDEREDIQEYINNLLDKQIDRIRTSENSPKNSRLYFSILLETNELLSSTYKLLRLHKEFASFRRRNQQ
ncbi:inorganic phosphate transporter [Sphingobacterium hotanense]|uniref:inorganic phosphate transporter n=1 Tax=Sphingobacterium hotanense TaxID=649196 RepID=UPI0021A664B4|nr:inorganic phosphate transporter [Sphingobacterium hotanense]MCT1526585.1 inorganic phosphate transporter [Sphingobacterium hotanense]